MLMKYVATDSKKKIRRTTDLLILYVCSKGLSNDFLTYITNMMPFTV